MKKDHCIFHYNSCGLFLVALILVTSCSQNGRQKEKAAIAPGSLPAPRTILFANLPYGSKPKVMAFDLESEPVLLGKKPPVTHSVINPVTHLPIAPEACGRGFFTNFTTDNGLALDAILCSFMDNAGNLWFGTLGGGVSRYDGKAFTNFTTTQGLTCNNVNAIAHTLCVTMENPLLTLPQPRDWQIMVYLV